jgi:hypothetical protein
MDFLLSVQLHFTIDHHKTINKHMLIKKSTNPYHHKLMNLYLRRIGSPDQEP